LIPEPTYTPSWHKLAQAGARAEQVADTTDLSDYPAFGVARRRVRQAIVASGVAEEIDALVRELLEPVAVAV